MILPSKMLTSLDDLAALSSAPALTVAISSSRSTDRRGFEFGDLDHVDQLEQLLGDLFERRRLDVDDDRDAAASLVLGRSDREREDVVAAAGEQPGDPSEHAGSVLDEHRQDVVVHRFGIRWPSYAGYSRVRGISVRPSAWCRSASRRA